MTYADGDLRVSVDNSVAIVEIARAAKRNALSSAIWRALPDVARDLDGDDQVRVVVFRGEGREAFSSGADISEFPETYGTSESARAYNDAIQAGQVAIAGLSKPALAMVFGVCVGAGCGLSLACDLRFAANSARFGITPSKIGAAYSFGDTKRLVDTVGPSRAKDILFSGRLINATEALQCRLVDFLIDDDRLEEEVMAYAHGLCALSQNSLRVAKRMVDAIRGGANRETAALKGAFDAAFGHADFAEGYRAFIEKRKPRFR